MTTAGTDALVKELDSAGDLPVGFGPLLHAVPREWFIPDRIWVDRKPIDRLAQPGKWLHAVYSDTVVVTQFDDGRTPWPQTGEIPTCSASMPSAVAGMLSQLDVQHGHSVLEIGTGTGFNAALLSELAGPSGSVTTVEIDPALADAAHDCLSRAGFERVRAITDDATRRVPESGPFDRIISTASVHLGRVPYSWVEQTKPGGVIVTPVRADLTSGPLVRFVVNEDGTATGCIAPPGVEFMELRSQRTARTAPAPPTRPPRRARELIMHSADPQPEEPPPGTAPPGTAPSGTMPPWAHRSWCAPDCEFRGGAVEGTHLSAPWVLTPVEEDTSRLALRLIEDVLDTSTGQVQVLVSVTERRLADDLDPFQESPGRLRAGLADITSSVGLDVTEAGRVFDELVTFTRDARNHSA